MPTHDLIDRKGKLSRIAVKALVCGFFFYNAADDFAEGDHIKGTFNTVIAIGAVFATRNKIRRYWPQQQQTDTIYHETLHQPSIAAPIARR